MTASGTILIVEDNEQSIELAKELLEEVGFQTLEAEDADASIRLAEQEHPDLILMDIYMPGKNGYEASQALKSNPETQDIPIVAFTALATEKDRKQAEASGCIGVISKPIDVDTFASTVSGFLANSQDDLALMRSPQSGSSPVLSEQENEFLLKLSHDLQGPIRKIHQFSSWLKKSTAETLNREDQDCLQGIDRAILEMQDVLTNALNEFRASKE